MRRIEQPLGADLGNLDGSSGTFDEYGVNKMG